MYLLDKLYKKGEILEKIKIVTNRMMSLEKTDDERYNAAIDMDNWQWAQGVGLYGMFQYYKQTNDKNALEYLVKWYDRHIENGIPEMNVYTATPLLALALLYEETGKDIYLEICRQCAQELVEKLPRTEQNGFQHYHGKMGSKYVFETTRSQLWTDTVYMLLPFLAKTGQLCKEQKLVDEAVRQMLLHLKYLSDKETGLWYHVWSFDGRTNFTKALWARGNCWVTAYTSDFLKFADLDGGTEMFLAESFAEQVKALKRFQHEDGAWSTLVDQMDTYKETSGTAGFAYGILKAVRTGLISEEYREVGVKALSYVMENIDEDGTVLFVSRGTGLSRWDINYYKTVGMVPMIYGQALAILALTEALFMAE